MEQGTQADPIATAIATAKGEVRMVSKSGGMKGVKPQRFSLVPWESISAIGEAFHYGATKYHDPKVGPNNWRRGYPHSQTFDALLRHLTAYWNGEDRDPESGLSHLSHAGWHVLVLIWFTIRHPEFDDRPHKWLDGSYKE